MQKATEIFNTDIKPISRSVLVVGGAGYIGSHLCKQLEKNGYVPVVVDRNLKNKPVAFEKKPYKGITNPKKTNTKKRQI